MLACFIRWLVTMDIRKIKGFINGSFIKKLTPNRANTLA